MTGKKVAIVKANFNKEITDQLLKEAVKALQQYKVKYDIFEVPGSFEIPLLISRLAKKYNGFIALGCLLKGETLHFSVIAYALCSHLMSLAIKLKKPIGFGVLTLLHKKQARARIKLGRQATLTVLELL